MLRLLSYLLPALLLGSVLGGWFGYKKGVADEKLQSGKEKLTIARTFRDSLYVERARTRLLLSRVRKDSVNRAERNAEIEKLYNTPIDTVTADQINRMTNDEVLAKTDSILNSIDI